VAYNALGGFKMRRIWGVVLLAVLFSTSALPEDPAPNPNPTPLFDKSAGNYLTYTELSRKTHELWADAQAEYLIALHRESMALKVFEVKENVFKKGHLALDQYKEAERDRDVAIASTRMLRDRVSALQATSSHYKSRAEIAAGAEVHIDKLYAEFLAHWHADCARIKSSIGFAEAQLVLADFRAQNGRKLHATQAMSYVDLLEREFEFSAAQERLKNAQGQDSTCMNDIPTLEFVRGILYSAQK